MESFAAAMPHAIPSPAARQERDRRRGLTWISLTLNLLLAGLLLVRSMHPNATGFGASFWHGGSDAPVGSSASKPETGTVPQGSPASRRSGTIWSRLVSPDPRVFAANLRQVGCPEVTVCDLVRPLIARTLTAQIAHVGEADSFWSTGATRRAIRLKNEAERRRLGDEALRMMSELACEPDLMLKERSVEVEMLVTLFSGFLAPGVRTSLFKLLFQEAMVAELESNLAGRDQGVFELGAEQRRRARELEKQVRQVMTSAEFQELDVRLSTVTLRGILAEDDTLHALRLTPSELREWVRLKASTEPSMLATFFHFEPEDSGKRPVEEDLMGPLHALLGDERYALYEKLTHSTYSQIELLAAQKKLAPGLGDQAYQTLRAFEESLTPLRAAWTTDPAGTRPAVLAARDALRERLNVLLAALPEKERQDLVNGAVDGSVRNVWRRP